MAAMGMAIAPARGFRTCPAARSVKTWPSIDFCSNRLLVRKRSTVWRRPLRICCGALKLEDRSDPLTETIAKKLIEIAQTGERDPRQLRRRAFEALGLPPAD